MSEKSRLREALSCWADSRDEHQREVRAGLSREQVVPIAEAPTRERVSVWGVLRTVTLRPRGGVPALEDDIDDGTGVVTIVWIGRRQITGIHPGTSMTVTGCIGTQGGAPLMFNPRYELLP